MFNERVCRTDESDVIYIYIYNYTRTSNGILTTNPTVEYLEAVEQAKRVLLNPSLSTNEKAFHFLGGVIACPHRERFLRVTTVNARIYSKLTSIINRRSLVRGRFLHLFDERGALVDRFLRDGRHHGQTVVGLRPSSGRRRWRRRRLRRRRLFFGQVFVGRRVRRRRHPEMVAVSVLRPVIRRAAHRRRAVVTRELGQSWGGAARDTI